MPRDMHNPPPPMDRPRSHSRGRQEGGEHHSHSSSNPSDTLDQRKLFFRGVPYHINGHEVERELLRFVSYVGGKIM